LHRSQNWGTPIVGAATRPFRSTASYSAALSVSSVGSWALQLRVTSGDDDDADHLSVSSVGSWALQPCRVHSAVRDHGTFSILSRIVGAATTIARRSSQRLLSFQYPQSDRGRCNYLLVLAVQIPAPTFSILSRIVGAATPDHRGADEDGLQPFSILSRIVGAATVQCSLLYCTKRQLSVSSVGSWALQLQRPALRTGVRRPFSILSRIVGAATSQRRLLHCFGVAFQYPQSDRGRCNLWKGSRRHYDDNTFSILSRIVGAATSDPGARLGVLLGPTFSILSRIVGAATKRITRATTITTRTFSILSRIVGAATRL
jgi:hypothetical protein